LEKPAQKNNTVRLNSVEQRFQKAAGNGLKVKSAASGMITLSKQAKAIRFYPVRLLLYAAPSD